MISVSHRRFESNRKSIDSIWILERSNDGSKVTVDSFGQPLKFIAVAVPYPQAISDLKH